MNTATRSKIFAILLYGIALVLIMFGVALNVSGNVRVGTLMITMSVVLALSTALKLKHLSRW